MRVCPYSSKPIGCVYATGIKLKSSNFLQKSMMEVDKALAVFAPYCGKGFANVAVEVDDSLELHDISAIAPCLLINRKFAKRSLVRIARTHKFVTKVFNNQWL